MVIFGNGRTSNGRTWYQLFSFLFIPIKSCQGKRYQSKYMINYLIIMSKWNIQFHITVLIQRLLMEIHDAISTFISIWACHWTTNSIWHIFWTNQDIKRLQCLKQNIDTYLQNYTSCKYFEVISYFNPHVHFRLALPSSSW